MEESYVNFLSINQKVSGHIFHPKAGKGKGTGLLVGISKSEFRGLKFVHINSVLAEVHGLRSCPQPCQHRFISCLFLSWISSRVWSRIYGISCINSLEPYWWEHGLIRHEMKMLPLEPQCAHSSAGPGQLCGAEWWNWSIEMTVQKGKGAQSSFKINFSFGFIFLFWFSVSHAGDEAPDKRVRPSSKTEGHGPGWQGRVWERDESVCVLRSGLCQTRM